MGLTQKRAILVKLETTARVDSTPTSASDAVLCRTSSVISPQGEEVSRDNVRSTFSPEDHIVTGVYNTLPLELDLRGSGTAGTAPEVDALLQICGLAKTVNADTSVVYTPTTLSPADQKTATVYWIEDGLQHKMLGCVGKLSLDAAVNAVGVLKIDLSGLWVDPTNITQPSPLLSDVVPPTVESLGLSVGGYTPVGVNAFSLDSGVNIATRKDVNAAQGISGFHITGRTPTGSLDPEVVELSSFNPWSDWKSGTKAAITATIGATAGNMIQVDVGAAQYRTPSYGDREGLRTYSLPFEAKRVSSGDDEYSLTFK